jgi:hypothetical protein
VNWHDTDACPIGPAVITSRKNQTKLVENVTDPA